jgi:hypothetical protein
MITKYILLLSIAYVSQWITKCILRLNIAYAPQRISKCIFCTSYTIFYVDRCVHIYHISG